MTISSSARMKGLAVVAIAAVGIAGCGSKSSSGANGGSGALKIGFFGALSGPNAQLGINIKDGAELAISQYNALNPKHKAALVTFDSQGDPTNANNGANTLIGDKVVAVIGPAFSGESKAADGSFETAKIPNLTASATNVALASHGWKYFHRGLADDSFQGKGDADYLVKVLHQTKVFVVDDNSTYGLGLADVVRSTLRGLGSPPVGTDHITPGGTDFHSTVNKITTSGATAVFFGGYYADAGTLIKELKAGGFTGKFMSGDGSEDQHIVADSGGAANANGAFLSCACADETTNPAAASFVSAYKAKFNTNPAIYSAEAYDVTAFVLAAIKFGNTTGPTINTYLANNSWPGLTKTLKFASNGNVASSTVYMYQVKNGAVTEIGTTS